MRGIPTGSMHGSIGDVDGDGRIDLLVVDLRHGALYRNAGDGLFEDVTASSGVKQAMMGKGAWAAAIFDYDNDGDVDIFSANGMADLLVDQDQLLLENDGQRSLSERRAAAEFLLSRETLGTRRRRVGLRQRRRSGYHRVAHRSARHGGAVAQRRRESKPLAWDHAGRQTTDRPRRSEPR